jgi:hypothetical protein
VTLAPKIRAKSRLTRSSLVVGRIDHCEAMSALLPSMQQSIRIHAMAPAKPVHGDACNGCGVCCLAEPCPLGAVLSLRRRGPCAVLRWDEAQSRYRCGAATVKPKWLAGLARRWIAAGRGCDSDAQATV